MLIGLDYGEKRIGIAVSDETEKYVKALPYIPNKIGQIENDYKGLLKGKSPEEIKKIKSDSLKLIKTELRKVFNKILYLLNYYYCDKIVIGIPLSYDSKLNKFKEGFQARKVKSFSRKFEAFLKANNIICEFIFMEESLTSSLAESNLRISGRKKKAIRENIDSESAKILLESFISKSA